MFKYTKECLYLAGIQCFLENGYDLWFSRGKLAQFYGFQVSMPSENKVDLSHSDPRKNADAIFTNCANAINQSTAILADLELFRGSEPDGGTVFELGMAYARGLRCYGFTRDKRDMVCKHQKAVMERGEIQDGEGRILPYGDLPFAPCVVGSTKIMEGSFEACLHLFTVDLEEQRKVAALTPSVEPTSNSPTPNRAVAAKPRVYLSTPLRYGRCAEERLEYLRKVGEGFGWEVVTPLDPAPNIPLPDHTDAYVNAMRLFARYAYHVRSCDVLLADLNDFHGLEPSSDTSFETGMAWQLGKRCFGHMKTTPHMLDKIPHYPDGPPYRDMCGWEVESFDYPLNLMFASAMPILSGDWDGVMEQVAGLLSQEKSE